MNEWSFYFRLLLHNRLWMIYFNIKLKIPTIVITVVRFYFVNELVRKSETHKIYNWDVWKAINNYHHLKNGTIYNIIVWKVVKLWIFYYIILEAYLKHRRNIDGASWSPIAVVQIRKLINSTMTAKTCVSNFHFTGYLIQAWSSWELIL